MKYSKIIIPFAIIAAVVALFVNAGSTRTEGGYSVGDIATDFSLKNIDGKKVSMADYDDAKGFLVVFTCNSCPFAVMYEDRIIDLNTKYASKGYPVIAINPNDADKQPADSFEKMKIRQRKKDSTSPT